MYIETRASLLLKRYSVLLGRHRGSFCCNGHFCVSIGLCVTQAYLSIQSLLPISSGSVYFTIWNLFLNDNLNMLLSAKTFLRQAENIKPAKGNSLLAEEMKHAVDSLSGRSVEATTSKVIRNVNGKKGSEKKLNMERGQ